MTTVRWRDPALGLTVLPELSGIEFMKKMADGELPAAPIASHFGMDLIEVGPGTVTFRCVPDESHYNPIGAVHGGLVCTLLDSALGCATHTTLPAGSGYTSIEIKVNYLRSVSAVSGALTCTGRVVKPGRRVAFAEGEVLDGQGKLVATASGSLLIFPLEGS
ncbi:aromatic compound degradation protein PaaI [Mycobacterium gordonae]|uniref:Aromatic compound degradation protein PaaI n=1 Tax=Mycobacterium gordonae TaxID=1778 RepID=A0A0Q2QL67_MYCGO|nr:MULTISPECIES: PaaI family thioesterase [Mycobacterium]KQH80541.1 aromatic compound degradation protein PaaI [Mycobacterium gordonae]MDP7729668.1 PaaI family thioesterase [Mycobacterium sp. TY813]